MVLEVGRSPKITKVLRNEWMYRQRCSMLLVVDMKLISFKRYCITVSYLYWYYWYTALRFVQHHDIDDRSSKSTGVALSGKMKM